MKFKHKVYDHKRKVGIDFGSFGPIILGVVIIKSKSIHPEEILSIVSFPPVKSTLYAFASFSVNPSSKKILYLTKD